MNDPALWVDARAKGAAVSLANLDPCVALRGAMVRADGVGNFIGTQRCTLAVYVESPEHLRELPRSATVVSAHPNLLQEAAAVGYQTGLYARIDDAVSMDAACRAADVWSVIFVELTGDTNIPLELLIARCQGSRTEVVKRIEDLDAAQVACGVLESGCDGVLVPPNGFGIIPALEAWRLARSGEEVRLEPAVVTDVTSIGMGARVCVDTVDMLGADEGMLVGSTAAGGILACAEVHHLPYMKLRPFRVNAGALHSYAACPGDRTAYLSELAAGDPIHIVSVSGQARSVAVGRAKTEVRPLLKVACQCDGAPLNVILQNDWHVRVFDADGRVRNVTTLIPGDRLLATKWEAGRHVGIRVAERLWES